MAKIDLTSFEWCELIFKGKNKAYGAYKMRADSPKRHNVAMVIVLIIALVGFSLPTLIKMATPKQKEVMTEVTTLSQLEEPEVKQEEMKRVEPVAPPPPALKSGPGSERRYQRNIPETCHCCKNIAQCFGRSRLHGSGNSHPAIYCRWSKRTTVHHSP